MRNGTVHIIEGSVCITVLGVTVFSSVLHVSVCFGKAGDDTNSLSFFYNSM